MDALDAFSGKFSEHLAYHAVEKRVPLSGTFELLPFCNMQCKMCYIVHEKRTRDIELKSVEFWDDLIEQSIEQGMLYALVTGGEPFIYPGFKELLERISKKPIHLALNTNGTLLDRENVEWLTRVHPGRLNISLYGGSNETYERLCRNPRGFDQVTRAFGLLNEYGIPYRVHSTITPDNYEDFDKIIEVCNKYHAPLQMAYYMFPPYRKDKGLVSNDARFAPKEAAEVALRIWKCKNKSLPPLEQRRILEANCACFEEPERYSLYGNGGISCRGGYASFWVDWRGKVSGCGIHTAEQIDLTENTFQSAWKKIVQSSEKTVISEKCKYCRYRCICPGCVAAAFCETGDVKGTPEYLCEFSEIYAEMLKEELKKMRRENV